MPPKQKQAKKGPAYKASVPLKDIIPLDIKQPPRQAKQLKIPQAFPEASKNTEALPTLFQEWPTQDTIKSHDFGVNSQSKFIDAFHDQIANYINQQAKAEWKPMNDLEHQEDSEQEEIQEEVEFNQSKNEIESFKHISTQKIEGKKEGPICVIETFMRPETEQQLQIRLKQEAEKAQKAAKDKKKAAKKEEPKEEGPIQVSDVQMSDIITRKIMTESAIWIGSQLQIIKQRNITDVNNNQPIWRKIYPQQNGVPQVTRSGKYWVKLLHMGKYVKIQIDDRVPVDENMRELFPLSAKYNEKWTLIITKALIKYLAKVRNDNIIGSGLVAYALTGMISENIPLGHFKQWQKLQELIGNDHYERKDMIVSCFSFNESKNFKKLSKVRIEKEVKEQGYEEQEYTERQIDTKIINGYAYCIGDYFDNQSFNMVFSQEKTQKEMLLKHQYNELCKISISNKSREQKLQYRKKKKELKEKLGIQEKKRLQLISKPPIRYHFLKLLASLKIACEYGQKQILLAKKCVLNKLNQPPNYDIPLQKQEKDTKSIQSLSVSVIKYKQENELFPNLHDFSSIPGVLELLQRKENGKWINDEDFLQFFEAIQILYNPNAFNNKKIETIESKKANNFTYDENKEILVVEKVEQDEQKEKKVRLLFGYTYQKSQKDIFNPYTILQKFDFDSFRSTSSVVTLSSDLSSNLIELKNQNSVFKLYTMSRGNYNYWISCDSPFKLISIADYLSEYEGYTKKNVTFEYPPIEAGTYFPMIRLKLKQEGIQSNTVLIKLVNVKDELLGSLNYRLVSIPKGETPLTDQKIEGIITKNCQEILLAYEYTRFVINSQSEYYLIVEAQSSENIPDGSLELLLLTKEQGLTIEQVEQVEPVKFIEKYIPNKYGMICKERIFTNIDNNATITVKLAEFEEQQASGAGKGAKKGGKEEPTTELIQKPFSDERSIILRILNGETVLYEAAGVNEITVPNFKFSSTKASTNKEYYLQVKFDLRIWPEATIKNQNTQKICWVAQIMAQDSLAMVRDTKQEDKQKQTRKSWEDSEPGRAERAKKARRKFLIELKKEKGENLTEEEEQILNAPRLTKKQLLQQQRKNEQNKKGGKGGKKDDKKAGKDAKKQEVVDEKPQERAPPKSQNNFMNEIKQFLKILQNCVVKYEPLEEGQSRIRSQEQLKSIKEGTRLSAEDRVGKLIRNVEKRQTMKIREKEKKETISIFFSEIRGQFKQKYSSYIQWRNQDIEKDRSRQDKQRFLIDIINQQKPAIAQTELKKNINEYKQINGHNPYLVDVADMVRKNIRIANLTEKITTLLVGWEVEELKAINEEIKNDKIEGIQPDLMKQFKDVLDEAEKNPNIVAEKQAQAKKAKKGGKK